MRRTPEDAWQDFRNRITALGGRVIEPEWLGRNTPHRVICRNGHEATPTPGSLAQGRGLCRACAGKDPLTAWRAFQDRVAELGGRVMEPEWLGCQRPHRVICAQGHEATPRPNTVQQGRGLCKTCAGNDTAATERAFRQRVAELGGRIIEPTWLGGKTPHRVVCGRGHDARPRPSDVLRGHGLCLTCVGKDPAVTEHAFRVDVLARGGQVLELAWKGVSKPHLVVCPEGHASVIRPASLAKGGALCAVCAGRTPQRRLDSFRSRVEAMGGTLVESEWLGSDVPHRVNCRHGHECAPRPADVGQGQGLCQVCAGNDSAHAWQKFRESVARLGGRVLEDKWLGSDIAHRVACRAGHETLARPGSLRRGQGLCRFCAGKSWDAFYVVTNDVLARVKFGITSGDVRGRLAHHRRNGYRTVIRTISAFAEAPQLESWILGTLRLARMSPVQGREYYDVDALPVILDVVDNWPSQA